MNSEVVAIAVIYAHLPKLVGAVAALPPPHLCVQHLRELMHINWAFRGLAGASVKSYAALWECWESDAVLMSTGAPREREMGRGRRSMRKRPRIILWKSSAASLGRVRPVFWAYMHSSGLVIALRGIPCSLRWLVASLAFLCHVVLSYLAWNV